MKRHRPVLILDYGSQYTQLIARRVRELGFYSVIFPGSAELSRIQEANPSAIILSGGPSSVYDPGAPQLPRGLLRYQAQSDFAILGICYGMQLLAQELGGRVGHGKTREYGRMEVIPVQDSTLFENPRPFQAWMSHGDEIQSLPAGFQTVAKSAAGVPAAFENPGARLYALQFHPEVTHTENGREILRRFLVDLAGLVPDWDMGSVLKEQLEKIREAVGPKETVLCALSGGVDSAVAAMIVSRAVGERLHCVFVDHGLLRYRERERVLRLFQEKLQLPVRCVDASGRFLKALAGLTDPEKKRKIIGAEFISVFEEAAKNVAEEIGHEPKFLVQGTLYPDVIESSPGHQHSVTIKSHHNVGGLPKNMKFKLIEPLRELFKDEVRSLGLKLGVPQEFLQRHPFPGPGLAVRIIGEITEPHLEILRICDEIFIESLRAEGLYDRIWQAFAVFLPIKSVGVQGDGRTHDHVIALRAVASSDGMTADWYPLDSGFLGRVSARICNEVRGVNRVVYDISSKPPATIEWE